jgi:hypothetical protein
MSAPALLVPGRRRRAARSLWILSSTVAVFSLGLAVARLIPPAAPSYVSVLLSTTTLVLNAAAIWLQRTDSVRRRGPQTLEWSGWVGLIGPCLTGFAWTGTGAVLPIVWTPLLTLLGAAGWLVWSSLEPVDRPEERVQSGTHPPLRSPRPAEQAADEQVLPTSSNGTAQRLPSVELNPDPPSIENLEPPLDPEVTQRLVRRRTAEGEVLEVSAALDFAPGEQRISLHLPISPPLSSVPEVECEPWEGEDLELQVGAAYPHGVRIDARRRGDAVAAQRARIGVLIQSVSQRRAA